MSPGERLEFAWEQIPNALVASTCVFLDCAGVAMSQGLHWWVPSGLILSLGMLRNFKCGCSYGWSRNPPQVLAEKALGWGWSRALQGFSKFQKLNKNWISLEPGAFPPSVPEQHAHAWIEPYCLGKRPWLKKKLHLKESNTLPARLGLSLWACGHSGWSPSLTDGPCGRGSLRDIS